MPARSATPSAKSLPEEVAAFIRDHALHPTRERTKLSWPADESSFEQLAQRAWHWQRQRLAPIERLATARQAQPLGWRDIPPVPTGAFKQRSLGGALRIERPGAETRVFRSSGTSRGEAERSVHHHCFLDLYRTTVDACFPALCHPAPSTHGFAVLSLIPPPPVAPDSSLSFMIDHVLSGHKGPAQYAVDAEGLDAEAAVEFLAEQHDRPVLILATAFALAELTDWQSTQGRTLKLPVHSVVFETGGFKGRTRELSKHELAAQIQTQLGVGQDHLVREYGMSELTSQAYTAALFGGDPELFITPPWMRVCARHPETQEPLEPGRRGLLSILDLANLSSSIAILTEDMGTVETMDGRAFRLDGRARGAELRGCSLTLEELGAGALDAL